MLLGKKAANILEQLKTHGGWGGTGVQQPEQGVAGPSGPLAARQFSQGAQGGSQVTLVHGEGGRRRAEKRESRVTKSISILFQPAGNRFYQAERVLKDNVPPKREGMLRGFSALQDDGDAASGEGGRQTSLAGKSFWTKVGLIEVLMARTSDEAVAVHGLIRIPIVISIVRTGDETIAVRGASIEEADEGLGVGGAKEGIPVIQQQRGLRIGDVADQTSRGKATGHPGIVAEQVQQRQADGLARLALRGTDIQVRSNGEILETIGMNDPQGEHGQLILGAEKVLADQGGDVVQSLRHGRRFRRGSSGLGFRSNDRNVRGCG